MITIPMPFPTVVTLLEQVNPAIIPVYEAAVQQRQEDAEEEEDP